jgi:hypothetical protein
LKGEKVQKRQIALLLSKFKNFEQWPTKVSAKSKFEELEVCVGEMEVFFIGRERVGVTKSAFCDENTGWQMGIVFGGICIGMARKLRQLPDLFSVYYRLTWQICRATKLGVPVSSNKNLDL